jgi:putative two-component system response regulator
VLVVDDDELVCDVLCNMMRILGYEVFPCTDPAEAQEQLTGPDYGLALIDIRMGDVSGFDILRQVRFRAPDLQVIMISGQLSMEFPVEAIREGAAGYLFKPVNFEGLKHEVSRVVKLREVELRNSEVHAQLQVELEDRTRQVIRTQGLTLAYERSLIASLCRLAEFRDPETGAHIHRMSMYCKEIAVGLNRNSSNGKQVDDLFITRLVTAAPLHDIGKAGIPDSILLKPGALSLEEFEIMKRHTTIGRDILFDVIQGVGNTGTEHTQLIQLGMDICSSHHERWDGAGYPGGLAGEDIPLAGRITTVADVYDALSCPRIYRPYAMTHDEVMDFISTESGKKFDPAVVRAFKARERHILEVRQRISG